MTTFYRAYIMPVSYSTRSLYTIIYKTLYLELRKLDRFVCKLFELPTYPHEINSARKFRDTACLLAVK